MTASTVGWLALVPFFLLAPGDEPAPRITAHQLKALRFDSPMMLEIPLTLRLPDESRSRVETPVPGVAEYLCEDVRISELTLVTGKPKGPAKLVPIKVEAEVQTEPSYDRLVTLKIAVVDGEEVLDSSEIKRIDAEEGKKRRVSTRLSIGQEKFPEDGQVVLQVTVSVLDNK